MNYKDYMNQIESKIIKMNNEELRTWIRNYLRQVSESQREKVLLSFSEKNNNDYKKEISEIIKWCNKINEGEIFISCHGYEDYSSGSWGGDWVYEYEDNFEIGKKLEYIYTLAEKFVYEKRYQEAFSIYENVNLLVFQSWDTDTEEVNDMEIEELVEEGIVSLNLRKISQLTAYTAYMIFTKEEKAENLYKYFSWSMFKEFSIEKILEIGPEEVKDFNIFMEDWISLLCTATEPYATRLLIEAIIYQKGEEGYLEIAKKVSNIHPILYVKSLKLLMKNNDFEKLFKEGMSALNSINRDLVIRGSVAVLTSFAALNLGKIKEMEECLWEAFYSDVSVGNYFNLIESSSNSVRHEEMVSERLDSLKLNNANHNINRFFNPMNDQLLKSCINDFDYYTISFFQQKLDMVYEKCRVNKNPLGWSTKFIKVGVPLFLILLYKNNTLDKAMTAVVDEIEENIEYNATNNKTLWDHIKDWNNRLRYNRIEEEKYYEYIKKVIDERIIAIVSGTHRKSYYKAALLAAAWGEVEESRNEFHSKYKTIDYYRSLFPRHRAFIDELKKW